MTEKHSTANTAVPLVEPSIKSLKTNNIYVNIQTVKLEIKTRNRKEQRKLTDIQRNTQLELKTNKLVVAIKRKYRIRRMD